MPNSHEDEFHLHGPNNLSYVTVTLRCLELALGVILCGLAGIFCGEAGCGSLKKGDPYIVGQSFALLVAVSGLAFSFVFLGCRCLPISRNWFRKTELALVILFSHGYAVVATSESFYASGRLTDGSFKAQFTAAAVMAWLNTVFYVADLVHLFFRARV